MSHHISATKKMHTEKSAIYSGFFGVHLFYSTNMVTRTGIENLGALFVSDESVQKSPKIRHFRTMYKLTFTLVFANFLHC